MAYFFWNRAMAVIGKLLCSIVESWEVRQCVGAPLLASFALESTAFSFE